MITYAIKTTFAMSAAKPPAHVALPLKTKLTVKKYVPIGSVIMANVKLINFQITEDGTAGEVLDGSGAAFPS